VHNPAWRPARLHTERLASIQHHYIDDRPSVCNTGNPGGIHTLPVHVALAEGHPATALQPNHLVDALTRQLNAEMSSDGDHTVWQLETIPLERRATNADLDFILVFATANLEGVRQAYAAIKKLSATPSHRFGVLFSGAHDGEVVARCQERLASGTQRFLGIRPHELGHMSATGPDFDADLARLAGEIQRLCGTHSTGNQLEIAHT
jgi:hypothetical protein